jgi:hypothetical protein
MRNTIGAFTFGFCLWGIVGCGDDGGGSVVDSGSVADGASSTADAGATGSDARTVDAPIPTPGGALTCKPAEASFPGPDGGVADGAARVCFSWLELTSSPTCSVIRDVADARMSCKSVAAAVELIAFGPEPGLSTWRGRTLVDDPPRKLRSSTHGTVLNDALRGEVTGLPTGTEIAVTIRPSVYWSAMGPDDYVVRLRIDPPTVTILSVGRTPAPAAQ